MQTALRFLTGEMRYSVPDQDLYLDLARMPTLPAGGLQLSNIRRTATYAY
jgi:fatty-acid peroxygenase